MEGWVRSEGRNRNSGDVDGWSDGTEGLRNKGVRDRGIRPIRNRRMAESVRKLGRRDWKLERWKVV
jgi:hypothetical protein